MQSLLVSNQEMMKLKKYKQIIININFVKLNSNTILSNISMRL
jgi:hypothetical protein